MLFIIKEHFLNKIGAKIFLLILKLNYIVFFVIVKAIENIFIQTQFYMNFMREKTKKCFSKIQVLEFKKIDVFYFNDCVLRL